MAPRAEKGQLWEQYLLVSWKITPKTFLLRYHATLNLRCRPGEQTYLCDNFLMTVLAVGK